jgi:hypothetical protein
LGCLDEDGYLFVVDRKKSAKARRQAGLAARDRRGDRFALWRHKHDSLGLGQAEAAQFHRRIMY